MTNLSLFDLPEVCTKICMKCKQEKPIDEFGNQAAKIDGKSIYCKSCHQEIRSDWYNRNKEKQRELSKNWASNNTERLRELQRIHYAKNNEKYTEKRKRMYEKHREKRIEYARQAKQKNRELHTQYQRLREAKRMRSCPKWANREVMNEIYRKAKEMQKQDGIPRHVDHIIPLQHSLVSGLHCEFNLQILTASENSSKKNYFDIETYMS